MTHYTVRQHKGRPVLFENDRPRPIVMYSPGDAFGNLGREDVDRFLAAGITDFYLWVGRNESERDIFTTPWWHSVDQLGEPDFQSPERFFSLPEKVAYILAKCPDARFLLRLYDGPPRSWKNAHPEEMAVDEDGNRLDEISLASELFVAAHRRYLQHLIGWVERQSWADRVLGYVTLHDYEGTTCNATKGMLYDYSAPMQRAFGRAIPRRVDRLHWPEPATTQTEREYFELMRRLFFERCRRFLEVAQAATAPRQVLLGMDALKQGMQGWICEDFFAGRAPRPNHGHALLASGSIGADEFLSLPGFNLLNTPYDYIYRHMGGAPEPEGIVDSVVLRGKLFLGENDCRTYTANENGSYGYYRDDTEAAAGLWRTAAETISRGSLAYWMDVTSFPTPRGGYFRHPNLMKVVAQIAPVLRRSLEWEHADVPGIAMVIDDRSALHEDFTSAFQNLAVMWQRLTGLAHCGVPYRVYLWEDLPNIPDHRLFIFPNLFHVDEERLALLKKYVCGKKRVVLWGPGTGITGGAERVTGMPMTILNESFSRRVVLTRGDHPITARLGALSYGDSTAYGPILLPEGNEQGSVLTSRGVNRPGLAIREMGDWTSVFTAAVPVPAELIREMARHAGAHVYSEDGDVIFASQEFLGVHSARSGQHRIQLPGRRPVFDLVQGTSLPATDRLTWDSAGPETRLFRFSASQ